MADDDADIRELVCVAVRRAAGADAYLAEPFSVAGLAHQVQGLTGGRVREHVLA